MLPHKTHLTMASALRKAKENVSKDVSKGKGTQYVCLAIDDLICRSKSKIEKDAGYHLIEWIDKQLNPNGGHDTFKTWGIRQGIYMDNYQVYRHAWIDHMIKVLES
jgi:hypothetical protein